MAGDNIYNLHLSLDQYKDQLEEIDGMKLGYALKYYTDWLYIFPMIVLTELVGCQSFLLVV